MTNILSLMKLSSRVEQRLAAIQNEIQAERRLADRQDDLTSLSSELKQVRKYLKANL